MLWRRHVIRGLRQLLSGEPDYFGRNKISSGGDLSHYSSASLYLVHEPVGLVGTILGE